MILRSIVARFGCLLLAGILLPIHTVSSDDGIDYFERHIRPILVQSCYECHATDSDEIGGNLLLDSQPEMLRGGDSGPVIDPENWEESLLLAVVEYRDFEMPPDEPLAQEKVDAIRKWLEMGAPDPRTTAVNVDAEDSTDADQPASVDDLWSLRPITSPSVPAHQDAQWSEHPVDAFILEQLRAKQLTPNELAESATLVRRLYFDLIGLPPSPEEVEEYTSNPTIENWNAIAQRLLESDRYGERWARHWLDVVRYGESAGSSRDVLMPYAWRYRNYVVDSFNQDIPFDRFVIEQIAGDLLPAETTEERDRLQVATGLLAIGSKSLNGGNIQLDLVDDQIDVVSRAFLGLTVSCARCHDHKFDPIPTADYYALAGIFRSTNTLYGGGVGRPNNVTKSLDVYLLLEDEDALANEVVTYESRIADLRKQRNNVNKSIQQIQRQLPEDWEQRIASVEQDGSIRNEQANNTTSDNEQNEREESQDANQASSDDQQQTSNDEDASQLDELVEKVQTLRERQARLAEVDAEIESLGPTPEHSLEYAIGVRDRGNPINSPIHIRGERTKTGDVVPRGFLSCVSISDIESIDGGESGRLELGQWITHAGNPLTSRVIVNRVWQHLFGNGLVETVDNFGSTGQTPSHPELLDYLSQRLVHDHQWSIKSLIAELVSTRTYRLSSENVAANYQIDPANQWRWRMTRRRLEAEPLRDAMLSVSESLVVERPDRSPVWQIGEGEVGRGINLAPLNAPFPHRSVYLPIIRGIVPPFLQVFDFPEPSNIQGQRDVTHIPSQALFLMNSDFVYEQARGFANRLLENPEQTIESRIASAYEIAYSRQPTDEETSQAIQFVDDVVSEMTTNDEAENSDVSEFQTVQLEALTRFCHALLASAEFRFVE